MAKKSQLIDKFLELRLEGHSFDTISKNLRVSKQTLIEWSKDEKIKGAIDIGHLTRIQELVRKYQVNREAAIARYAKLLDKVLEELQNRDFENVPTEKLTKIAILYSQQINKLIPEPKTFEDPNPLLSGFLKSGKNFTFDPLE